MSYGEQSDFRISAAARRALHSGVRRVEAHGSTPGCVDARGRDWNNDTLLIFTEQGTVVHIVGGCFGLAVTERQATPASTGKEDQ